MVVQPKSKKRCCQPKITQAFDEVFGRGAKTAVVIIEEVSTDNYAIGGETITKLRQKSVNK